MSGVEASFASPQKTILRVKRRRTEDPFPYLRLSGLSGDVQKRKRDHQKNSNDESAGEQHATVSSDDATATNHVKQRSTVLWKRLDEVEQESDQQESYRLVDAQLLEEDDEGTRQHKRRKLTLLDVSHARAPLNSETTTELKSVVARRPNPGTLKVLDPLTRLIDDSLQEVHQGNKTVVEHYRFLTVDSRFSGSVKKGLLWCHSSGGNILHACALWNDVDVARTVLDQLGASTLTDAGDEEGRTPYEVAQLSGHDSVCKVLEAFGGDTTNFVYDLFYLEPSDAFDAEEEHLGKDDANQSMTVELTEGMGYWTPEGELVLEANEKDHRSLSYEYDDGDVDSNCEEWGGNDYPDDEEEWGQDIDVYAEEETYLEYVNDVEYDE